MTAALDLFAEKDYAAVTTTEIARIVGVRHSLIYYYFDSKDDLFHKTIQNFHLRDPAQLRQHARAA